MPRQTIRRILVWSSSLRLAHGLIALSVLVLAASGWLIQESPSVAEAASDWHDVFSVFLILGLALRLWLLLFGKGPAHWRELLPGRSDLDRIGATLRFYVTLGKAPLPRWYAHNPLWAPLYLLILAILLLQTLTGLLMDKHPLVWMFYLPHTHAFWADVTLVFIAAHLLAVVLHDVKGTGSDVSAMLNGHRIFISEETEQAASVDVQIVSVDAIQKSLHRHY